MKAICLYFEIHHPEQLRKYHFFDIGKRHDYFDYYVNRIDIEHLAKTCYLPANEIFKELIQQFPKDFKVAFSISGSAIELLELQAPEVILSLQDLAQTGNVEFLCEPYSHSLSSLSENTDEFEQDVHRHIRRIEELFGKKPTAFRNTSLIYSDAIGERIAKLGFKTILTEGAKHVLGWRSPNFVYHHPEYKDVKILLKNSKLSDDISLRFSHTHWQEYPLTAEKYANWLHHSLSEGEVVNLFMDYQALGKFNLPTSGIFDFMKHLPKFFLKNKEYSFVTPSEATAKFSAKEPIFVPYPISWTDEERDITSWLGNELQQNAFEELFSVYKDVKNAKNQEIKRVYSRLQASNHFYYMRTKLLSSENILHNDSPYDSPYQAYINYMNVLSDFQDWVRKNLE